VSFFLNHVLETIIKGFDGRKAVASYTILFQDQSDKDNWLFPKPHQLTRVELFPFHVEIEPLKCAVIVIHYFL